MNNSKMIYLAMVIAILQLNSCDSNENKPETIPTVKTLTAVSTGTTTATVTGEITDDGNTSITEAGFVYSSNVTLPTTADNKKAITDFENFEAELSDLNSGTVYNVRAYAINKKGTSYGDKLTVETGNAVPVASNVVIAGTAEVNKLLTLTYTYTDAEGDEEDGTSIQWYAATDATGTGEAPIAGATATTFLVQDAQNGKFIRAGVTPKSDNATASGAEVKSNFTTAIGAETVTFTYNNVSVTYGTIISPVTQKKWLDRNLGASRVAQSTTDYQAYGDLFQWGRLADGHQLITRTNGTDAGASGVTGVTDVLSDIDVPPTNKFITAPDGGPLSVYDWRSNKNKNLWQGVSGINNPCPSGWRVATQAEWAAEGITNIDDGFSKLKLSYTGWRNVQNGNFAGSADRAMFWTSTSDASQDDYYSMWVRVTPTASTIGANNRGNGYACRCIKD